MFHVDVQEPESLVRIRYWQRVDPAEVVACLEMLRTQLEDVQPGFRLLTDLSELESMDFACAPHIGNIMDLLRDKGVNLVVRVVPDTHKDIGLNILSFFHYGPAIRTETYETLADAMQSLSE